LVDATGDGTYTDPTDLNQTRTHNLANELTGISTIAGQTAWANPTHDSRGNMVSVPKPSAMNSTYTCAYDSWNRLTKVTDGQTTIAEYRYDGLDRRIRKFVPAGQNWTVTEYYYSASWQVLETRRNTIPRSGEPALASTLYEQYVWSPRYIDSPILRDRSTTGNGTINERRYYLTDAQSNVTTLLNAAGDPVERYTYDPYGKVTIYDGTWTNERSASADANEVLYCGYRRDSETGLYHVRNRNYHPLLGRWMQRDPLDYVDGMNLYEYCWTSPVNAVDPLGLGSDGYGLSDPERIIAMQMGARLEPVGGHKPPPVRQTTPDPWLRDAFNRFDDRGRQALNDAGMTLEGTFSSDPKIRSATYVGGVTGTARALSTMSMNPLNDRIVDRASDILQSGMSEDQRRYFNASANTHEITVDVASVVVGPGLAIKLGGLAKSCKGAQVVGRASPPVQAAKAVKPAGKARVTKPECRNHDETPMTNGFPIAAFTGLETSLGIRASSLLRDSGFVIRAWRKIHLQSRRAPHRPDVSLVAMASFEQNGIIKAS